MTRTEPDVREPRERPKPAEDRITLRHNPADWVAFDAAVKAMGYRSRNAYLSAVIDWVLRKPNAKAPKRPPAHDDSST
jgi:hypothetical protein